MSLDAPPKHAESSELEQTTARLLTGIRDPIIGQRAREEMDRMREETRKRIGTVDVAVELIHDARDR